MKKAANRLLQFLILPLWVLTAFSQLLAAGVYCGTYWLRYLLLESDTKKRFSHPKVYVNRIFEATDKHIYPFQKD